MNERKVVLFPQGPVPDSPQARAHCEELLFHAGGDPSRFIDLSTPSVEHYVKHIARNHIVAREGFEGIVVLTHTEAMALTLGKTRHALLDVLPHLIRSIWIIYADTATNPRFIETAKKIGGEFDTDLEFAPFWTLRRREKYLILSPHCTQGSLVTQRAVLYAAYSSNLDIFETPPRSVDVVGGTYRRTPTESGLGPVRLPASRTGKP